MNIRQTPMYHILFMMFLAACSFLPIQYATMEFLGNKVQLTALGCVSVLFMCVPLFIVKHHSVQARQILGLFSFVLSWGLCSMLWSPYVVDSGFVVYPLFMAFLTMAIPYLVTKADVDIPRMVTWFTFILTTALMFYLLRFYHDPLSAAVQGRLSGYIGGSAVLHIIMVPMLAVCMANIIEKRKRFVSLLCTVVIIASIFSTQSRAGFISLGLFAAFMLLNNASSVKRLLAMLIPIGSAAWLIQHYATIDRYTSYDDVLRTMTRELAFSYTLQSPNSFLFGNGFGSIWPYFAVEKQGVVTGLIETPKGLSLYHPHSVFLEILAELGALCLLAFIVLLFIIVREFFRSRKVNRHHMKTYVLAGIICTFPALYVDLFFFKNWLVSIVWWFYLFTALSIKRESL